MDLSKLQFLKYLKDFKGILVLVVIVGGIYLMVKSPKIKTTFEAELYKKDSTILEPEPILIDTMSLDSIAVGI